MARGEDGFGLIEVLVTATLLAVGMVAIIGGLDSSRNLTTAAEENQARTHTRRRRWSASWLCPTTRSP